MHIWSRHLWTSEAIAALGSGDRDIHDCGGRNRVRYAARDLKEATHMTDILAGLIAGLIFGLGLCLSGLADPPLSRAF